MKFRRFIRSFAIALLTLCLSVWVWSYFHGVSIEYRPANDHHFYSVGTYMGGVGFCNVSSSIPPMDPPGWLLAYERHTRSLPDFPADKRFMGFIYYETPDDDTVGEDLHSCIGIPFWFPSLLSAALLWLIWRQIRPKTS